MLYSNQFLVSWETSNASGITIRVPGIGHEETGKRVHELLEPGSPPDEETQKKMTELQKTGTTKILDLLTEAQKEKWKEVQGEPFKGEIHFEHPVIIRNN